MSDRQSFYVGVKAMVPFEDGVLVLKETDRDKWEFPGGRMDKPAQGAELSIFETLSRELEEEIKARLVKLGGVICTAIGDYMVENDHRLLLLFYAPTVELSDTIQLSSEHTEYAIATVTNFRDFDMYTTDLAALEKYFEL